MTKNGSALAPEYVWAVEIERTDPKLTKEDVERTAIARFRENFGADYPEPIFHYKAKFIFQQHQKITQVQVAAIRSKA